MKHPNLIHSDSLLDNIFVFYGAFDSDYLVTNVKGSILDSIDIDIDLLKGQNFLELIFWQTDKLNEDNLKKAVKVALEKGFAKIQIEFRVNAEKKRYFELNLSVNTKENNSVEDIFFCATDVTTKMQEVAFYKERSEHFLYAAENAEIGLWFWDLQKDEIVSTPRCNMLLDLDHHEVVTIEHFLQVLHPDDKDRVEKALLESQKSAKEYSVEYRIIHSDGNIHWVSAKGKSFFDKDSNPLSMMGSVRRTTDEKTASQELKKIYEMESESREEAVRANKAKDYFLALVSHELRSPLNSILGWTQILLKKEVDKKTRNKAIETIERSAKSQSKLIEDLVDSARVTSGKLKLVLNPVNLINLLKQVKSSQKPTADNKEIDLTFTYDTENVEIFGDLVRLQQIFINLLTNSIKFTPNGGKVSINLKTAEDLVFVQIIDTGQGISKKDLPNIFTRFAQGDNETTNDKKGLGLGLSIARILTEKQNGQITASSEGEGKGSTFQVVFPIHFAKKLNKEIEIIEDTVTSGDNLLKSIKILVVEDDQDSREVLELFLQQTGAQVQSVDSVHNALETLEKTDYLFDIILSDLAMPEEDGYSLIQKVRAMPKFENVPAIALSAFTSAENKQKAFEVGFQKYHTKPFEPDVLVEEIIRVIKNAK